MTTLQCSRHASIQHQSRWSVLNLAGNQPLNFNNASAVAQMTVNVPGALCAADACE